MTPRLYALVAGLVALLILFGSLAWQQHRIDRLTEDLKASRLALQTANRTIKALDALAVYQAEITTTTQEAQDAVRHAPGADAPLSPAVSAAVRNGVGRLRSR